VQAIGVTLSAEQRDFVGKRIDDYGLADRVEVRKQDYRELSSQTAQFDAVASIEMGEHVGEEQYATYVDVMHRVLKPGGRLLLQQMARAEDTAPGGGPFIEAYIAPDMHTRATVANGQIRAGRRFRSPPCRGDARTLCAHRRALAGHARRQLRPVRRAAG
jgi:cyclopropane fatty-acyl-phospholipid synthase-like methyltransferase